MNYLGTFALLVLVQVTVISVVGGVLLVAFRRKAANQHSIALISLVLILLSPLLVQLLPSSDKQPQTAGRSTQLAEPSEVRTNGDAKNAPIKPVTEATQAVDSLDQFSEGYDIAGDESTVNPVTTSATPAPTATRQSRRPATIAIGLILWILGSTFTATRWWFRLRRLLKEVRGSLIPAEIDSDILTAACSRAGLAKPPPVFVSEGLQTPVVLGVLRPYVVLPKFLIDESNHQQLTDVLLHEYAHIMRRDPWIHRLQQFVASMYWLHPGVWWLNRELSKAREEICDNYVLHQSDAPDYAQTLLHLAERCAGRRPALSLLGLFVHQWTLESRVAGILNPRRDMMLRPSRVPLTLCALLLCLCCWLTGGIAAEQDTEDTSNSPIPSQREENKNAKADDGSLQGVCSPGAIVRLFVYPTRSDPPVLKQETTADAEGRFSFPSPPAKSENAILVLAASKPGFSSSIRQLLPDRKNDLHLTMDNNAASLSGTVTNHRRQPVVGAVVSTQRGFAHPIPGVHTAISDQNGRYQIADLKPWNVEDTRTFDAKTGLGSVVSRCFFQATHRDYPLTLASYSQIPQQVDITLHSPAIIEGQVVDLVTGKPMPGVPVKAQGVARGGWFTTITSDEGNYSLRMTDDHYNIWAEAPERMPLAVKTLKATPGERMSGMDIRMARGGYVVGKVVATSNGKPINGDETKLYVAHYGPARPETGAAVTSTLLDADGTYRLHVAPGRNYVYLMSGNSAAVYLNVGDGQEVQHDFVIGTTTPKSLQSSPDRRLGARLRSQAVKEDAAREQAKQTPALLSPGNPEPKADNSTLRGNTPTGKLLTTLEEMNSGSQRFRDEWASVLRDIIEIGPEAVPELIEESDRNTDALMQSCLGFIFRAIDDKRAVPALIRSIPKSLRSSGSDMGLRTDGNDDGLTKFLQRHDLSDRDKDNRYSFGRPVRETFGALQSITGQDFGEKQLFHVFVNDNDFPGQRQAKAQLFQRMAIRWSEWWEEHWNEFTKDMAFSKVNLAPISVAIATKPNSKKTKLKSASGISNWALEAIHEAPQHAAFYDLDTGRATNLPNRWRDKKLTGDDFQAISSWAEREGFDMMGDVHIDKDGKRTYALRPIGLKSWELAETRWKESLQKTSAESLQKEGRPNDGEFLMHFDAERGAIDPLATATFFYWTREGTPGILYVGVEVQDDSMKSGGFFEGDDELNPVAFRKGRRFGLGRLVIDD